MSIAAEPDEDEADLVTAKPPFIRRVRIRGYKSIAFCDVSLEPLTILVGRNASGKSNFVDALGLLADLGDERASEAIDRRGGWKSVCHRGGKNDSIEFQIEAELSGYQPTLDAEFSFALGEPFRGRIPILRERLLLTERSGEQRRCGYEVHNGVVEWIGSERDWAVRAGASNFPPSRFRSSQDDRLLLSTIGSQPIVELCEELRASHTHNFSASAMRPLRMVGGSPHLDYDGANLARAIEGLREIDPLAIDRITHYLKRTSQYLSAIVEDVEGFDVVKYGEYETIQFRVATRSSSAPLLFDAANMSDGTLRALASLVAAFQIYLPTNASGFVAIEEPETSLHPAAMRALVSALDEASLQRQVLLTTHSPELLDAVEVHPANIRVVEMVNGATVITPLDEVTVSIIRDNFGTLGGLERDRQLILNESDQARQVALADQAFT